MKADFSTDFGKRIKTLEIAGKVYSLELENLDKLKAWRDKGVELEAQINVIRGQKEPSLESLVPIMIDSLDTLLDDGQRLWDECGHSPWAMVKLVQDLAKFIIECRNEIKKHYGIGF